MTAPLLVCWEPVSSERERVGSVCVCVCVCVCERERERERVCVWGGGGGGGEIGRYVEREKEQNAI